MHVKYPLLIVMLLVCAGDWTPSWGQELHLRRQPEYTGLGAELAWSGLLDESQTTTAARGLLIFLPWRMTIQVAQTSYVVSEPDYREQGL